MICKDFYPEYEKGKNLKSCTVIYTAVEGTRPMSILDIIKADCPRCKCKLSERQSAAYPGEVVIACTKCGWYNIFFEHYDVGVKDVMDNPDISDKSDSR